MATGVMQQDVPRAEAAGEPRYKRALDLVLTIGAHVVLSPLLLLLWVGIPLAIWLDSGRPIFYRQRRLGRGGATFMIIKFRTMVADAEQRLARDRELRAQFLDAYKLRDDPRITRVGRWLRAWSLDELPQLLNVLTGEMTLVGPRPIVEEELSKYGPCADRLLSVRPGLTGLWQALRHEELDYPRRVSLDMEYISRRSLAFDLGILLRTMPSVLGRRGAY